MTEKDKDNLQNLKISLAMAKYIVSYKEPTKNTNSLYRFGYFIINGYEYFISAWSFHSNIVTFENKEGKKVKYNIETKKTIGDDFKTDTVFEKIIKFIRIKLSSLLKDLSDKLQP